MPVSINQLKSDIMDILLNTFIDFDRWSYALSKGVDKDIRKDQLEFLAMPSTRIDLYYAIKSGKYRISPPHTAKIPKDNGDFRTVYVNEPIDRVVLSIINDILFELMPEMVHSSCKSYQKGIGCGKVVQEVSKTICNTSGDIIGWKSDLSKYFDSVPLSFINAVFDRIEEKLGKSAIISLLRDYYSSDLYFDENGQLCHNYQSLKQGCAVAAFLADAILFHIDEKLSSMDGYYVRYSDDMIFVGNDHRAAMECLESELAKMDMKLNPKKVEELRSDHWFKFLGFSIKGKDISLSSSRIKKFQKEIESRTIKRKNISLTRAVNLVNNFLYKGDGTHSWATQILPVCNVRKDIDTLNTFVMDCLRAVSTGKKRIGGIGYIRDGKDSCVSRGKGRNVSANRNKTSKEIPGYLTMGCMQNAMRTSREAYRTLVSSL
jgi:hypothetical protein